MFTLIITLLAWSLSCSSVENGTNETDPGQSSESTAETPAGDEGMDEDDSAEPEAKSEDAKASRQEIEAPNAAQSGLGPTDTIRAFNDAVINRDAAKIRSFLTRGSIKLVEDSAKEQGRTVDDILTSDDGAPMPVEREMRNETIEGNKATVEVKNSVLGNYDKMYLVKEKGNWRIELDKFQDEMIRKLNELQKDAPKTDR